MIPALVGLLYLPVVVWASTGIGLALALRRSAPSVILRLAATFLALWALLATTVLAWVIMNGGWTAILPLAVAPWMLFAPRAAPIWLAGGLGALLVFSAAFLLNQSVGRGFLRLLRPRPMRWPSRLPAPRVATSLLTFDSARPQAFSFALLEAAPPGLRRREVILLSTGLLARLAPDEQEAAIAHEYGHLRDLDGRYLTFFRTLARMMRWDPVLAHLASMLTRREEFRADEEAIRLTRRPLALARALYKVARPPGGGPFPATVGFLGGAEDRSGAEVLERIRRLVALAESGRFPEETVAPP